MYGAIYRRLVYPTYHSLIRSGALPAIRELAAADSAAPDELREYCSSKLLRLLMHAAASVPYYGETLSGMPKDVACDVSAFMQTLPLLTKETIREQGERLVSHRLSGNRLDPNSTSGSTGSPLTFYTDRRSKAYRKATVVRNRNWLGISMGDAVAHLWGSPIDQRRAESMRGRLHSFVTRELFLSAYVMDDRSLEQYAMLINRHRARLLIGYPSALVRFGEFCAQSRKKFPKLAAIICSAEVLDSRQRQLIEAYFGVPVFNRYGCREVGDIAQEAPGIDGLMVNSDRIFVEILDADGAPCPVGETGDIVVTDLDNYGMPLIRYAIGDRGSWKPQPDAPAKYPYPVLETVEGRSLDVVVGPSGNRIGGTFWTILLRKRPGLDCFRVVQDSLSRVTIEYTRLPDAQSIDFDYFTGKIKEACGQKMEVRYKEVAKIARQPGEKLRLVVSRVGSNDSSLNDLEEGTDGHE